MATTLLTWGQLTGWLACLLLATPMLRDFFTHAGLRWLLILLFSFLLSSLLTPIMGRIAFHFNILDQPNYRKVHKKPTPLLGGVAIYLAFTVSLLINNIFDTSVLVILGAASLVMVTSLVDDAKDLSAKLKLVLQLLAVLIVYASGLSIKVCDVLFQSSPILAAAGDIFLTFLWIIGITNAMNFLDGTDGLAAGLGVVISCFLGIVAFLNQQAFLGWFAIAMTGSCIGFLPYNFRRSGPALIFLGDTGSTFIGFVLACLAIKGEWSLGNPLVSVCTPLLIFGILIFDMTQTTVSRIATGKVRSFHDWVAYVGKDHIHHRLYRLFQNNKKTVLFILCLSACLGVSAIVLRKLDTFHSLLIVFQGIIAFSMFAAVNCYQEKALVRLNEARSSYRIMESYTIPLKSSEHQDVDQGVMLDVTGGGAKILVKKDRRLSIGSELSLGPDESPLTGKVVWQKNVILDHDNEEFCEYGVQFDEGVTNDVQRVREILKKNSLPPDIISTPSGD